MKNPVTYRTYIHIEGFSMWVMCTPSHDTLGEALAQADSFARDNVVKSVQITGTDQCTYQQVYAQVVK